MAVCVDYETTYVWSILNYRLYGFMCRIHEIIYRMYGLMYRLHEATHTSCMVVVYICMGNYETTYKLYGSMQGLSQFILWKVIHDQDMSVS